MKRVKRYFVLAILLCLITRQNFVFGQEYIYKQYTTADGLPSSEVYHVFQDSKGNIWFATDNGVSRYNGYEFENFDVNNGLPSSSISEIYEDQKGRVWFIGISSQLSYYQNDSIIQYKFNNLIYSNITKSYIYLKKGFFVDSLDNLYISAKGAGLLRISAKGIVSRYNDFYTDSVTQVIHYVCNNLKIPSTINNPHFTFNKVCINNKSEITVIALSKNQNIYPHHIFILNSTDSSFWYFAGNHAYFIENDKVKFHKTFSKNIIWAGQLKGNSLALCTIEGGLSIFNCNGDSLLPKQHLLDGKSVSSVLQDKSGGYWFSTMNNGVYSI